MRAFLVLLLCALLPGVASARWYQVDVVVFRHNGETANGGEEYAAEIELPDYSRAMPLITEEPAALSGGAPGPATTAGAPTPTTVQAVVPFTLLDRGERTLAEVERRLRNSREYTPVMSASWRQPNLGVAGAKTVYLTDLNTVKKPAPKPGTPVAAAASTSEPDAEPPKPVVAGTVTVKVARLMNVDVDFVYDNNGVPVRLRETRKVKLREIHYFDHPLFGVIVQVTPWMPPNEDPARAAASADEPDDDAEEAPQPPPMPVQPAKPLPAKKTPDAPVKPKPAAPKMRMKPSTE
jgi:hypothetical protein